MTAPKHTPGPWVAHSRPDGSEYGHHVTTAGGLTVCAVAYQLPTSEAGVVVERERISNARLIAAAPELLEACKELAALVPLLRMLTVHQVLDAGDDAISAAGLNPYCINEGLAEGHEQALSEWKFAAIRAAIAKATGESA